MKGTPVEVLCIGSELLSGKLNTHLSYFSVKLREAGLTISRSSTLPDSIAEVSFGISAALSRSDVIIISGGLGPTFDDLTREAAAQSLGRGLRFQPKLFEGIKKKFKRAGVHMPDENRRQAYLLDGARALDNPNGSAPGQLILIPRAGKAPQVLAMLPGPFHEMAPMFESAVLPVLEKHYGRFTAREVLSLHFCGLSESAVDEKIAPVIAKSPKSIAFTILGGPGLVHVHAVASGRTRAEAKRDLGRFRRAIPVFLQKHLFGEGTDMLEAVVGRMLKNKRATLAVAESCTGGLLASRLTEVSGSSEYFVGGVVAYSNSVKTDALGVAQGTLAAHGAVSEATAREMAEGARKRFGSDYAVSITGIAGPGGGTAKKPVGLVYIGLAGPKGRPLVVRQQMYGDRHGVRERSVNAALNILRRVLQAA